MSWRKEFFAQSFLRRGGPFVKCQAQKTTKETKHRLPSFSSWPLVQDLRALPTLLPSNDPVPRPTGRVDCNQSARAGALGRSLSLIHI